MPDSWYNICMLKEQVHCAIAEALGIDTFTLLYPRDRAFGDFAIHIHQLKKLGYDVNPKDILRKLSTIAMCEKVKLAGNFINFFLKKEVLVEALNTIIFMQDKSVSNQHSQQPAQRISLEFGQPNTHKLPHIGHLFSYAYGESMARILAFNGHTVFRCNYQGDVGPHVAKCLYVAKQKGHDIEKPASLEEKIAFLQKCYQEGSALYEADPEAKKRIDQLNKDIYQKNDDVMALWETTRSWSIEYYKDFEKLLGTTYDRYYFESETSEPGAEMVRKNIGTVFEESDGAVVFRGEKYGLHTRVFLTKLGTPTYEAKDVGLVKLKNEEWPFDRAIVTTATEQSAYWQVVKKAIELVFPHLEGKITHTAFGMIDLKEGKMSSRTGNVISGIELIKVVKKNVLTALLKEDADEHAAEVIAVGAVKYAFLKSEARKNMLFDIEQSVSVQGNAGPYLQYTYARLRSVLTKAAYAPARLTSKENVNITAAEDIALLRMLPLFKDVAYEAAQLYAPHLLCTYIYELAQACNLLYDRQTILKASKKEKLARLALLDGASQTLKTGLYLLGIDVLERI